MFHLCLKRKISSDDFIPMQEQGGANIKSLFEFGLEGESW